MLAKVVFDEHALETFVVPVLADLQQEIHEAGDSRTRRLAARVRGYLAFWRVVMAIPFAIPKPEPGASDSFFVAKSGGNLLIVLSVALLVAIAPVFGWFAFTVIAVGSLIAVGLRRWNDRHPGGRGAVEPLFWVPALVLFTLISPMFAWFVVAVIASGVVMSIVLRRWNTRHPSELAAIDPMSSSPRAEINLSSIPVAGDIGGLMFVVGTFVIVLLGLPDVRWFVLGSIAIGMAMAGGLFAWRSSRASTLPRVTSILR
jgi:hypothetical protein